MKRERGRYKLNKEKRKITKQKVKKGRNEEKRKLRKVEETK